MPERRKVMYTFIIRSFLFLLALNTLFVGMSSAETTLTTCQSGINQTTNLDKSQYVEMMSPDEDNMRVIKIGQYSPGSIAPDFRMALYVDAGGGDPAGAVKMYDSGQIHRGSMAGYYEVTLPTPVDLPRNTLFGLATRWDSAPGAYYNDYCTAPNPGYTFYDNSNNEPAPEGNSLEPFLDAVAATPNPTTWSYPYQIVIAYIPVITSATSPFNDGGSATVTGTGFDAGPQTWDAGPYIWLTENNDWDNPGVKIWQQLGSNTSTSATFTVNACGLYPEIGENGNKAYVWIEDAGGHSDTGYEVTIGSFEDTTPPVPFSFDPGYQPIHIDPDSGTYVPSTATISDSFGDVESPITQCEYTIDGGATWLPALSPTKPSPVVCTAPDVPIGPDGAALTIQMRARSCGGWSSPPPSRTLYRTADTSGPVSGASFTATPTGDSQCSLAWDITTDNGIGMHDTYPYRVLWSDFSPPLPCSMSVSDTIYYGAGNSFGHTGLTAGKTQYYRLCYQDNFNQRSEYSGDVVSCILNGIHIEDGPSMANKYWVAKGATNVAVSVFTAATHVDIGTITGLTVTGTNTANISKAKIYLDNGTVPNDYDTDDTFVAETTFTGNIAVFTGLNIPVTTSPVQYLITYDITANPTFGETVDAYISSGQGGFPVISYDNPDIAPKIDNQAPVTSDNTPAAWQTAELTISLSRTDAGSGFPPMVYSLWGCLGNGCTPALLGGNTMTTNCGQGNECALDVRYYSVDKAGNYEQVKTGPNQAKTDRKPPIIGMFKAWEGYSPMPVTWSDITEGGSGIQTWNNPYKLFRADGGTPPADCSGNPVYQGNTFKYDDASVTPGQWYSYRLCVYDAAGNVASATSSAMAGSALCKEFVSCDDCHGAPPNDGPFPKDASTGQFPGSHQVHMPILGALGGDCWSCHGPDTQEVHANGAINMRSDLILGGYYDKGTEFPQEQFPVMGSCFGTDAVSCHGPGPSPPWGSQP